jgi:glycerophosphoryl diester phosphodiesterase
MFIIAYHLNRRNEITMMRRIILLVITFTLGGCSIKSDERTTLPENDFLIIAHRGASAYAPDHTLPSYELAIAMGADYLELDLHMTKDKHLVALHDRHVILDDKEYVVADLTFDELERFSPGRIYNEQYPDLAQDSFESLSVLKLDDILSHFKDEVNYYIEIKSPTITPGIETELIHQLQSYQLLNRSEEPPKVIIQSYNASSLKKVFKLAPSIPLVQLYSQSTTSISARDIRDLVKYASGIGVNQSLVTPDLIKRLHQNNLHIHPFVVNETDHVQTMIKMGANGIFTDKPDIALEVKKSYHNDVPVHSLP